MPVGILIHNQSDNPAFLQHIKHFPYPCLIGDMHADHGPVLIDEPVRPRRFLLHRNANQRNPRHSKSATHQLPIPAVSRSDNGASARRYALTKLFQAFDAHVIFHLAADNGKAQNLKQHRTEADRTCPGNPLRLLFRCREAVHNLPSGQPFSSGWNKQPDQRADHPAQTVAEAAGKQAGRPAHCFKYPIRSHFILHKSFITVCKEKSSLPGEEGLHGPAAAVTRFLFHIVPAASPSA